MTQDGRERPRCRYLMLYLGRRYCREIWRTDIMAESKELTGRCPDGCEAYEAAFPTIWEREDGTGVAPEKKGT